MDDDLPRRPLGAATARHLVLEPKQPVHWTARGRVGSGHRSGQPPAGGGARRLHAIQTVGLVLSLAVVALLTLTPHGQGWAWGSPIAEAHWYVTGLDSTWAMVQLTGNLTLLVVPSALAVLRWPALSRPPLLAGLSLAAGTGIELLQRLLPLGRIVSPLDALLNATGAIAAGVVTAHVRRISSPAAQRG